MSGSKTASTETGTASRFPILPTASNASKAAPRIDASGEPPSITGRPKTSAMICNHTGDERKALPVAITVAPGAMSSRACAISAKRYAIASSAARRRPPTAGERCTNSWRPAGDNQSMYAKNSSFELAMRVRSGFRSMACPAVRWAARERFATSASLTTTTQAFRSVETWAQTARVE